MSNEIIVKNFNKISHYKLEMWQYSVIGHKSYTGTYDKFILTSGFLIPVKWLYPCIFTKCFIKLEYVVSQSEMHEEHKHMQAVMSKEITAVRCAYRK